MQQSTQIIIHIVYIANFWRLVGTFSFFYQFIHFSADKNQPIVYEVIRVRDGRSFSSRIVQAKQNDSAVFTAQISFQVSEPDSISHMTRMPEVPPPDKCEDAHAFFQR